MRGIAEPEMVAIEVDKNTGIGGAFRLVKMFPKSA